MYRSLILSDERLDYDRVDRIFAGGEAAADPWGEPLAAAAGGVRGAGCRAARRRGRHRRRSRARCARGRLGRAAVQFRRRRQRRGGRAVGADRVPPAHRAPDDRRQRAGGEVPLRAQDPGAVPRARAARGAGGGAAGRPARVAGRTHAAGSQGPPDPAAGRRRGGGGVGDGGRLGAPDRPRRPGADQPGAALAQAGLLRPAQPGTRRPGPHALLPLHLADPPLPGPHLPPRAAQRDRRRADARRVMGGERRPVDVQARARGDDDRARRRRRRTVLPARARAV